MTNEEAIKCLKTIDIVKFIDTEERYLFSDLDDAFNLAIKALEQHPSEDCISREDVDAYIAKLMSGYLYDEERTRLEEFSAYLWELPSVTPRTNLAETSRDCISRQAVIDYAKDTCLDLDKYEDTEVFCDEIKAMPSVTPERPKGKWIGSNGVNYTYPNSFTICSVCKCHSDKFYKYCPNCGAEMIGGGEDENNFGR